MHAGLRSTLPLLLFVVLAAGAGGAFYGDRGILANRTLQAELARRQERIVAHQATVQHLRSEIVAMRSDPAVQERWVRQELGYVRDGEILYLFPADRGPTGTP